MDLLSSLNPEQREAVLQTEGAILILAGAGSGKTRVIAHRIAHLVSADICPPDRVLAVTFTNKAAEDMRTRVEMLLGVDCQRMWISTFHALCARLLRREGPHVGLSRDFVIYDSADQLTLIKRAMRQLGLDDAAVQPRLALSRISHAKPQSTNSSPQRSRRCWNKASRCGANKSKQRYSLSFCASAKSSPSRSAKALRAYHWRRKRNSLP